MAEIDCMLGYGLSELDSVYERERALLNQLIAAMRLYSTSVAVQELFEFAIHLRARHLKAIK